MKNHAEIFNTTAVRITLLLMMTAYAHLLCGQPDCSRATLEEADKKYHAGRFDDVTHMLKPCLIHFRNNGERSWAHELLAKTCLANDSFPEAREHINEMLRYSPDYQIKRSESQMFTDMVTEARKAYGKENFADILVTTATKRAQLSSDAPATIHVRTQEQIIKRGYRNLIDLLEDIPEVEIQKNSISEFRNIVTFRGIAGNEKFIIMLDGIRITPATGDPYTLGTNYSLVNAKRVEVILGPASSLYGVDAFSGIINIITTDSGEVRGVKVSSGYGQYGTTDHALVAGAHTDEIAFSLAGHYYHSREPDFYNRYRKEFAWYNEQYLPEGLMDFNGQAVQVTASPAGRKFEMPTSSYFISGKLNFGDFEVGFSRNSERHSSSISVSPQYTLYTRDAFISTALQSVYAKHLHKGAGDRWSLQSYISSNHFVMDPGSKFMNRYTEYKKGYKYQFGKSQKIEEQLEYNISSDISCIAGVSFEDLDALPKTADLPSAYATGTSADEQNMYYLNTDTTDAQGRSLMILQDFHYLNYQNYGAFFQVNSKARLVETTLGGRFDYNTRFGSVFSPRLGVVFKAGTKTKIKLLYGRSFLAPSPWKAYSTFGSFNAVSSGGQITGLESSFFHIPNTSLKPERLTSLEGSVVLFPVRNLFISAGGYYNTMKDLINIQAAQGEGYFKGVPVAYMEKAINEGLARTYGGTLNASYTWSWGKSQVDLSAAYSYTDGVIDNKPLVLTAKHTVKAVADWSYGKCSLSLRFIHRTRSNAVIRDAQGNYLTNRAFSVLHFFGRYRFVERKVYALDASLRVDNLTDNSYYHVAGGQDSFAATPQDPVRIAAGLSLNFQ